MILKIQIELKNKNKNKIERTNKSNETILILTLKPTGLQPKSKKEKH